MKILVIGGTRFLGLYITKALLKRKYQVVLINRGTKYRLADDNKDAIRINCDKNNYEKLKEIIISEAPDVIIDTILQADDLKILIPKLLNLKKLKSFIHCGSVGVYAPAERLPSLEDDKLELLPAIRFNYKLEQDNVLMDMHQKYSFPAVTLRITNVYGVGDIPLDIWGARNPKYFQRLKDNKPITIPDNGMALLQPGYVEDLAEAFVLVAEEQKCVGEIFNVASHRSITLNKYVRMHKEILKSKSEINYMPKEGILNKYLSENKVHERGLIFLCEHMCVDFSKIRRYCGYMPKMGMKEGFEKNIRWLFEIGYIQ